MEGMAAASVADAHMEELVERCGAPGDGEAQLYHDDSLLAPVNLDFIVDEHSSAHSNMEVTDRLMSLEQRLQMQEDEVQLLKIALADVLKRLNISEVQTASRNKTGLASKPVSMALPPTTSSNTGNTLRKSSGFTLPSSTSSKNYKSKRGPAGSPKNSSSVAASRCPAPSTSTNSTPCKKLQESSKPKETTTSVVGSRRVTHCKVTMQIYLSRPAKKTGPTEKAAASTAVQPSVCPPDKATSEKRNIRAERMPPCSLSLQRSTCQSPFSPAEPPIYKSPIKYPSQYFQICY